MIDNYHVWQTREWAMRRARTYREVLDWAQTDQEKKALQAKLNWLLDLWGNCWSAMCDDVKTEAQP